MIRLPMPLKTMVFTVSLVTATMIGAGPIASARADDETANNSSSTPDAAEQKEGQAAIDALRKLGSEVERTSDGKGTVVRVYSESRKPSAKFSAETLKYVGRIPDLMELDLMSLIGLDGALLHHLAGQKKLRTLFLPDMMTDTGLEFVAGLTNLKDLSFGYSKRITSERFAHLKNLTNLRILYLDGTSVDDEGLVYLERFTQLRYLSLPTTTTDAGLAHIKKLHRLQDLSVRETQISDAGLKSLSGLAELEKVDFQETKIDGSGCAYLKDLGKLHGLNFRDCTQFGDQGLKQISEFKSLNWLDVGSTAVTDAGIAHLRPNRTLKRLFVEDTAISDAAIPHFREIAGLGWVRITGSRMTQFGIRRLKRARPELTVAGLSYQPLAGFDQQPALSQSRVGSAKPPPVGKSLSSVPGVDLVRVPDYVADNAGGSVSNVLARASSSLNGFTLLKVLHHVSELPPTRVFEETNLPSGFYKVSAKTQVGGRKKLLEMIADAYEEAFAVRVRMAKRDLDVLVLETAENWPKDGFSLSEKISGLTIYHGTLHEGDGYQGIQFTGNLDSLAARLEATVGKIVLNETDVKGQFDGRFYYRKGAVLATLEPALRQRGLILKLATRQVDALFVEAAAK